MNRPKISINFAISADGKITSTDGIPSGWTSKKDHSRLLKLRKPAQALMVGRGTLESDWMTMRSPQNPLRCIISKSGNFDASHPIFSSDGGPIHLLGTESAPMPMEGATIHHMPLQAFLEKLRAEYGVQHIHCEGGGQLVKALAELDLIDEVHLTWAGHKLFGGAKSPSLTGMPGDFLPASRHFKLCSMEVLSEEGECFLSYERAG